MFLKDFSDPVSKRSEEPSRQIDQRDRGNKGHLTFNLISERI